MPWDVQYRKGVRLPQINWWLDARFPAERSFVSHAHSDHIAAHRELVCARTLRERGIEAWALGEANQLELGLAAG